jgi:ACS family glucarate transporter-like MFS transporter
MNMGCQIGGAVTASLTPYIAARYGWDSAFAAAAILAAAGGAMWLFVDPGRLQRAKPRTASDATGIQPENPVSIGANQVHTGRE